MTGKEMGITRIATLLLALLLALPACAPIALAGDPETEKELPGVWTGTYYLEAQGDWDDAPTADLATLVLEENGKASLSCRDMDVKYAYSCEGTWTFEYVPDMNDRLTLLFTSTDNPAFAGQAYSVECVYEAYTESWTENDTLNTFLILTPVSCSGVSPFEDLYGDWETALHREQGPNMRVVNCDSFVSLRESRSTSSKRLAKVPLGALVLAFPEAGEENGFILCTYHDQYGYILADYLAPAE